MHPSREVDLPVGEKVALQVEGISKAYTGVEVLSDVSFTINEGSIHALLGENGSGKSTLIKILAGVASSELQGQVTIGRRTLPAADMDSRRARMLGLRFVHQDLGLFPDLSVAENLEIGGSGYGARTVGRVRWRDVERRARDRLSQFGVDVRPKDLIRDLRPSDRTFVAIARSMQDLDSETRAVLVLDEPTASLPHGEVEVLLAKLRSVVAERHTVLLVSHRLDEVLATAEAVTVLRDGRVSISQALAGMNESDLVESIIGRNIGDLYPKRQRQRSEDPVLTVKGLEGGPLKDVSLELHPGEVVGIAGLLGSGRTELLEMIYGLVSPKSGSLTFEGTPLSHHTAADSAELGIAYIPEDRLQAAAFTDMTVMENLSLRVLARYFKWMRLRSSLEKSDALDVMNRFHVTRCGSGSQFNTLSGGNQQKVVLSRWLRTPQKVLLLDNPTQGVDVNARSEIYGLIFDAVAHGAAVLLVSADFEELARVSDRILHLRGGRIVSVTEGKETDRRALTEMAYASGELEK